MPIWTDIRLEIEREQARDPANAGSAQDRVRRGHLQALESVVGHPAVVYATDFTNEAKPRTLDTTITANDKDGWVEVTRNLPDGPLDLIIHSPGGSPFVAEWIVDFLRARFGPIRAIVPHSAKSAAAMIALSCDELLMDDVGELGPIDPQMVLVRDQQTVSSPAQAIKDQFATAKSEIQNSPGVLAAWMPILRQYGPSLLTECDNAISLSTALVQRWLEAYMFEGEVDAPQKAKSIADWVGDHNNFKAHARQIGVRELHDHGVKVRDMRTDPEVTALRDPIWRVWSCYRRTFDLTGAYKILENSLGEAFIRQFQQQIVQIQGPGGPSPNAPQRLPAVIPGAQPNRSQRRAADKK
jgi:serine dehydrogenase proteinase